MDWPGNLSEGWCASQFAGSSLLHGVTVVLIVVEGTTDDE